ncbi:hypothetical protein [Methylobacterium sp. WSM2598]|uniref:hypothetical protein n=1 Tax=Methylobacterium sp. WSM2598 TaxID=398261 RepID=UPI0003771FAA|nr:hypothetical protein [Methylobacterium sp. WSM2598]
MSRLASLTLSGLLLLVLAACAAAPAAPDLTPPPRKPADAKTTLESGAAPRR